MYLKHNMSRTPEYRAWRQMKDRCTNPRLRGAHRYIGRGITVCEHWMYSFENFYKDMGPRPSPDHSLDRVNNNGNYEPTNCRWATRIQQQNNAERVRLVTFQGETKSEAEWARSIGIQHSTLLQRLRYGWSWEKTLTTKRLKPNSTRAKYITFQGRTMCVTEWANHLGICKASLQRRLKSWPVDKALTAPRHRRFN